MSNLYVEAPVETQLSVVKQVSDVKHIKLFVDDRRKNVKQM